MRLLSQPLSGAIVTATAATLAGDGLSRLHACIRRDDPSCEALSQVFVAAVGLKTDSSAAHALLAVAAAADRSGIGNAFHNPAHSREVALNWWLLARLDARPRAAEHIAIGLIAAFGHDLHHDGTARDPTAPLRLERIAAAATTALMCDAGLDNVSCATVEVMILATDTGEGYRHLTGRDAPAGRFAALANPDNLRDARLLRDADLLPSAGTSPAAYCARTAELERELALPAGALSGDVANAFFDHIVERRFLAPPSQLFMPNLDAIVASLGG